MSSRLAIGAAAALGASTHLVTALALASELTVRERESAPSIRSCIRAWTAGASQS